MSPDGLDLKALKAYLFGLGGRFPDVLWDGYANPANLDANGKLVSSAAICVDNGAAKVLNVDLANDSENVVVGDSQHACQHEKLPAVVLEPPLDS